MNNYSDGEVSQPRQDLLLFHPKPRSEEDVAYFRRRLKEMHLLSTFDATVVQFLANDAATIEQGEELLKQAPDLAECDRNGIVARNVNRVLLKVERLQSSVRKSSLR